MRRLIAPLVCLIALGLGACGGDDPQEGGTTPQDGVAADGGTGNTVVPKCPFTAAQVSEMVGQPLRDDGKCLFGDGIAVLTITMASEEAGAVTYDYQRKQADQIYRQVKDIDKGGKGYIAVKDIQAEAVVVDKAGSYTIILASFQRLGSTPDGYERTLRKLLDALPL